MSKPANKLEEQARIEELKELKKKKKELKEQQERERKLKEERAIIDREVVVIYQSGLAEAYKCKMLFMVDFLQEAYREEVKFNIFEYAAQKVLKF